MNILTNAIRSCDNNTVAQYLDQGVRPNDECLELIDSYTIYKNHIPCEPNYVDTPTSVETIRLLFNYGFRRLLEDRGAFQTCYGYIPVENTEADRARNDETIARFIRRFWRKGIEHPNRGHVEELYWISREINELIGQQFLTATCEDERIRAIARVDRDFDPEFGSEFLNTVSEFVILSHDDCFQLSPELVIQIVGWMIAMHEDPCFKIILE